MVEVTSSENEMQLSGRMASIEAVQETLEHFLSAADVSAVYGEPIQHGDTLIIPTAEVLSGMGFGLGLGGAEGTPEGNAGGGGGGGGGRVLSRPVAAIIATPDGVRVEPVIDVTKLGLAALTAAGFIFTMIARMARKMD